MPGAGRHVPGRPFLWLGNKGKLWPQLPTPGPALLLSGALFKFNLDGGSSESSWYWKCLVPAGRCGLPLFQGPLHTVMGAMLGVGTQDGGCVVGAMVRLIPGLV